MATQAADLLGDVVPHDGDTIQLAVYRRQLSPQTREPTGYIVVERMRTLREVFADLDKLLDVVRCDRCGHERPKKPNEYGARHTGCGGEYESFLDEYFNGPDYTPAEEPVPDDYRWIVCYPVTGGSEGHYVHVEFHSPLAKVRVRGQGDWVSPVTAELLPNQNAWRITRLALGKTFRGMDHAAEIARRCAKFLGA